MVYKYTKNGIKPRCPQKFKIYLMFPISNIIHLPFTYQILNDHIDRH